MSEPNSSNASLQLQLENSQSFLRQLIDSSVEYVAVVDRNLNFLFINKRYEDALMVSNDWARGKNLLTTLPHIRETLQHQSIRRALQGETVYLDKRPGINMSSLFVDTYYIPLKLNETIEGVIIMSRDITEMVRTENLLAEKNRQLEETIEHLRNQEQKDKQKDNFIQMASHELKTPVTSIKGYVQFLLKFLEDDKEDELPVRLFQTTLTSVDKQVSRLTNLITDLLDLTKIDRGGLELLPEPFDLGDLLEEIAKDFRFSNTQHSFTVEKMENKIVKGDRERIRQVLVNLVSNAVKYSPRQGLIQLSMDTEPGCVIVRVKDNGIGIAREDHHRIFERFYRVTSREASTFPGFGIGLYIANEIVAMHGGKIEVESNPGDGSTFSVSLPLK